MGMEGMGIQKKIDFLAFKGQSNYYNYFGQT